MGYSTDFYGHFTLDREATPELKKILKGLSTTRRMARNVGSEYGVEGEFYFDGTGYAGQDHDATIIDYNRPPETQPGLWCQWKLTEDGKKIEWDGGEKFYDYVEWIEYIIEKILQPRKYRLNGEVEWHGEEYDDMGRIVIKNNKVSVKYGKVVFR